MRYNGQKEIIFLLVTIFFTNIASFILVNLIAIYVILIVNYSYCSTLICTCQLNASDGTLYNSSSYIYHCTLQCLAALCTHFSSSVNGSIGLFTCNNSQISL